MPRLEVFDEGIQLGGSFRVAAEVVVAFEVPRADPSAVRRPLEIDDLVLEECAALQDGDADHRLVSACGDAGQGSAGADCAEQYVVRVREFGRQLRASQHGLAVASALGQ
ncbi:hypothetical protein AB0E63_21415 [Kribbella sp. NPDC026596]|uniref:hypothetical protein n=1 Tax=Kribbella sp. NPDC026596 TaxID=3155122 RepID=UPI0033F0FCB2